MPPISKQFERFCPFKNSTAISHPKTCVQSTKVPFKSIEAFGRNKLWSRTYEYTLTSEPFFSWWISLDNPILIQLLRYKKFKELPRRIKITFRCSFWLKHKQWKINVSKNFQTTFINGSIVRFGSVLCTHVL